MLAAFVGLVPSVMELTVGGVVSFVTVAVVEPVLVAASVTQTRIVFEPIARSAASIAVATVAGCVLYVPESTSVPVAQVVPPTRTLYVPFSFACQVTVVPAVVGFGVAESIATLGAVTSNVNVIALPVDVFPALSITLACAVKVPPGCTAQLG